MGSHYYYIVRGIDNSEVKTEWTRKSLGNERTFAEDINDMDKLLEFLGKSADKISSKMKKEKFHARTLTLKIKFANFDVITKSKTLQSGFDDFRIIFNYAIPCFFGCIVFALQHTAIADQKIQGASLFRL